MSKPLIYIAHPISGDSIANAMQAKHYLYAFIKAGHLALAPYVMAILEGWGVDDNPEDRERFLRWDEQIAARCDWVALCGPRISEGMKREAAACGLAVDLTGLEPKTAARITRPIREWTDDETL